MEEGTINFSVINNYCLSELHLGDKNDDILVKKSESLQTEGRHFRSMICKINDV